MSDMERRESYIDLSEKIGNIQVELARGFAEFHAHHKESTRDIQEIKEVQNKILYTLYGNGKEGLVTTVAKIHSKQVWMWSVLSVFCALVGLVVLGSDFPGLSALVKASL